MIRWLLSCLLVLSSTAYAAEEITVDDLKSIELADGITTIGVVEKVSHLKTHIHRIYGWKKVSRRDVHPNDIVSIRSLNQQEIDQVLKEAEEAQRLFDKPNESIDPAVDSDPSVDASPTEIDELRAKCSHIENEISALKDDLREAEEVYWIAMHEAVFELATTINIAPIEWREKKGEAQCDSGRESDWWMFPKR